MRSDVAFAVRQFGISERRACKLVEVDRSSYHYEPPPDHNAELRQHLVEIARQKPRYGYGGYMRYFLCGKQTSLQHRR